MTASADRLRDTFRARGRRLTPQRRLVLQVLRESDEHLDAEALYSQAKKRDPAISLATVYRTLTVLKEMGLVEEDRLGEEHGHFEAVGEQRHYHFVCLGCGQVVEFDTPLMARIERDLCGREGVQIVDAHLQLRGYCARCRGREGG